MTRSIHSIYSEFTTTYQESPDFTIDFYNANFILLNNIDSFNEKEELQYFIRITSKYVDALHQRGRYNESIDKIDNVLNLIDPEADRDETLKDSWYHSLSYVKALSSYKLRDFKVATHILKELIKIDPKNDNYRNWLTFSVYGKRLRIIKFINVVSLVFCISVIFFKTWIPNYYLKQFLLATGLIGIISVSGYEYYIKRSFRKVDQP